MSGEHELQGFGAPALLVLADGRVFRGVGFGARTTAVGELVFNTAMSGYQEIVTDPSYTGQLVCLTVAEVGNVGVNPDDEESRGHGCAGLIVRSLAERPSNWRATQDLPGYLAARGLPGICELDTRALTRTLRTGGSTSGGAVSVTAGAAWAACGAGERTKQKTETLRPQILEMSKKINRPLDKKVLKDVPTNTHTRNDVDHVFTWKELKEELDPVFFANLQKMALKYGYPITD